MMNHNRTKLPLRLHSCLGHPSRTTGRIALWLASLSALALLTACSSTHIQSARVPVVPAAALFHKVLVVGMDERPDVRRQFEVDMVYFLKQRKVEGVASYQQFALSEFKGDRTAIRQKCVSAGAESVLLMRITGRTTVIEGHQGGLGSLDGSTPDETSYELFTAEGTFNTDIRLEAKLFRVSDAAPIWNGVVDTIIKEDRDTRYMLWGVAKAIVARLAKDQVIP
jgi:hypothetical protein